MMVTIFAQTDKIMIKMMLGNAENGYYSTAVACAGLSGFVFLAILTYLERKNLIVCSTAKKTEKEQVEKELETLYDQWAELAEE